MLKINSLTAVQILAAIGMFVLAAAIGTFVTSCTNTSANNGPYEVTVGDRIISVTPYSNDIFQVTTRGLGEKQPATESQSVVMTPEKAEITTKETPEAFLVISPTTTLRIDRTTGNITFLNPEGKILMAENGGVDNSKSLKSVHLAGNKSEALYGAGERGHRLDLFGDTLTFYNRQNYGYTGSDPRISQMGISVPFYASDAGYGVLFDDYNNAAIVLGDTVAYTSDTPQPLSYYFINGNGSLAGTTEGYTQLTGRQGLPPFWSLGYITSKYGYHNQKEAEGAIDSLKTRGYPVDGMVLDLYWYGTETDMGRLAWDTVQWPDHRKMLSDLKEKGVNTVLISQPYVNKIGAIDNYNLLSEGGMLAKDSLGNTHDVTTWVGDAGMIDVSNPTTREWLWNRLRGLTEEGVAGWWGDLGEPEVHPLSIVHANGQTASQFHNAYGNEWSRLIYEGMRKDFPDMRPMLMMRGGTAGLQRYNVFPWTTDVSRSWGGLEPQINLMLSSGISGLAYMSSDLGGFAVDPENPRDDELYTRWVEMGAFTPSMRTHAQLQPEPYHYPGQETILKDFIKMRYRWLPYNYTLAYENATKGWPLARPLNFHGDNPGKKYAGIEDEYLWGDEVLVAPVLTQGATSRKVVFPAGEWIDWNNPAMRYKGDSEADVEAPLDRLPLFVRAGSFIPQYTEPIENVTQYDLSRLTMLYFPSTTRSSYTLFDDDRKSPESIADGKYQLTTFTGVTTAKGISITFTSNGGSYTGMPDTRKIEMKAVQTNRPGKVTLKQGADKKELNFSYDEKSRTLSFIIDWNYKEAAIEISD